MICYLSLWGGCDWNQHISLIYCIYWRVIDILPAASRRGFPLTFDKEASRDSMDEAHTTR